MNILITGNQGYVGSILVPFLRRNCPGIRIVGYDTGFFASNLSKKLGNPDSSLDWNLWGDIRDVSPVFFEGFDAVVHLASLSDDSMGTDFSGPMTDVNARATARLAGLARSSGVKKFIFASSCSLYGVEGDEPKNERSQPELLTDYTRSKFMAEQELLRISDRLFQVYPLRLAAACGGSPRMRLDLILNNFVTSALKTGKIQVEGDGSRWCPLIHTHDIARAILWALLDTQIGGNFPVNVGSDKNTLQTRAIADEVAKQTGAVVTMEQGAQPDKRSCKVDFALFAEIAPQFTPLLGLEEMVRETISVVSAIDNVSENFVNDPNFNRHAQLQELVSSGKLDESLRWK